MNFPDPTRAFVFYIVYNEGGIRPAAKKLGRTPSAVSEQMEKLQSEVGAALYFMFGPIWRPTRKGEEFYHNTAKPIGEVLMREANSKRSGEPLRIGASHFILQEYIVPIVRLVDEQFQGVSVTYRSGPRAHLEALLCDNHLDLAILTVDTPSPGILWRELLSLPVVLLTPEGRGEEVGEELRAGKAPSLPRACPPPEDAAGRSFDAWLRSVGIEWTMRHEADEVALVPWIVGGGKAAGPCPRAATLLSRPGVESAPLPDCAPVLVGAAWCGQLRPVVKALLDFVEQKAREINAEACATVERKDRRARTKPRGVVGGTLNV